MMLKHLKTFFLIFIITLIFFPKKTYSSNLWEPVGFSGGGLFPTIAVDSVDTNVIYLGSDVSGVYKSTDFGETWGNVSTGVGSPQIASLEVDPSNHLSIFACTPLGLYKTVDAGTSWSVVNSDIHCFKHINLRAIAISQDGQTILVAAHEMAAGTEGFDDSNFSGRLYRSSDGGSTWSIIQSFSQGTTLPAVRFDPQSSNQAFLLMYQQGVQKSTDGGITWQDFSSGLPSGLNWKNMDVGQSVIYIAASPTQPYKSDKSSPNWTSIRQNLSDEDTALPTADAIRLSPSDDQVVYYGQDGFPSVIYKSSDGGQSWVGADVQNNYQFDTTNAPFQIWADRFQATQSIAIDPQNPNRFYYTTWFGVWKSEDGGTNWKEVVIGAQNTCCTDIEFVGDTLFATHMDVGVFSSLNFGTTWTAGVPSATLGSELEDLHAWSVKQGADGKIYAAFSNQTGPKVYRSDDGGSTWQDKSTGLVGTGNSTEDIFSDIQLAADPNNPGTLYLSNDKLLKNGLFKTTDSGDSWQQLTSAPGPSAISEDVLIKTLEVDPTNSSRIFAGLYFLGLWYSEDGGQTWTQAQGTGVDLTERSVQHMVALEDGTVYAAYDDGLYKSVDNGHTFTKNFPDNPNLGESTIEYVESIAFNPNDTNEIFVSTAKIFPVWYNQGSVWQTKDGGQTWVEITGDLPIKRIRDLVYNNGFLYAATWCVNVYRLRISDPVPNMNWVGILVLVLFMGLRIIKPLNLTSSR